MKKVIYTVLVGENNNYGLKPFKNKPDGWDAVCFTDRDIKSDCWDIRRIQIDGIDVPRESRIPKILYHDYISEYDMSFYMDSKFSIPNNFNSFIESISKKIEENDIITMIHPKRKCLFDEGKYCQLKKLDSFEVINHQMNQYEIEGVPRNMGLWATGIMIRNHNKILEKMMIDWNDEVMNKSRRDLLSFSYSLWKNKEVKLADIAWNDIYPIFKGKK